MTPLKILPAPTGWVSVQSAVWLCCKLHSTAPQSDASAEASAPRLWWSDASQMKRWMVIGPCRDRKRVGGGRDSSEFTSFSLTLSFSEFFCCLNIDLPFKASKLLCIAHNFAEVDVKHVSAVFQHDVVVVAVTDPQDEGGHAPPCTRVDEVHHSLRTHTHTYAAGEKREHSSFKIRRSGEVTSQMLCWSSPSHSPPWFCSSCGTISRVCLLAGCHPSPTPGESSPGSPPLEPPPPGLTATENIGRKTWLDNRRETRQREKFMCVEKQKPTLSSASRKTSEGDHSHVEALLKPNPVHHTHYLKHQHVLTQVISCLKRNI